MAGSVWRLHGDGRHVLPGEVVAPDERLAWPYTIGVGVQHVLAMFGATFLVPVLTGFPVPATLFFSGVGTLLFLAVTRGRVPSYLGSSFAFIAPVTASTVGGDIAPALGGILATGVVLALVGLAVQAFGTRWVDVLLPPVVTGAVVALIGLNLVGAARDNYEVQPWTATLTLAVIVVVTAFVRGFLGRLSILVGVAVGWAVAAGTGGLDPAARGRVSDAAWVGLPDFTAPRFTLTALTLTIPVVLVLVAENVGHVKAVGAVTGRDLDPLIGRTLLSDGLATTLAGAGGGSGTTTYAENIGVMAATRVYSSAAYVVAAAAALVLSLSPKFGALVATVPAGVLGGATTALYGLIAVVGARIWIQSRVDFREPANLFPAAVALVVGAADYTLTLGRVSFNGIALGTVAAVVISLVMRAGRRSSEQLPAGAAPDTSQA